MSPKRAINLARVSTPQQAKLYSLDHQLEQERAYCAEMGFVVVAEFKDDTSGRKLDRDGLEQACQMLENNEADVLVVWKFDRLHRHYVNSVLMRERIRKAGKEIHYAQSKVISGKTARQRLPEDLQFILAEIEADDIEERRKQGTEDKAKAGRWVGMNRPPYGYRKVGMAKNAEMVIDEWDLLCGENEAARILLERINNGDLPAEVIPLLQEGKATAVVIRLMFAWYVIGEPNGKPLSTLQIAQRLTALNIPTAEDLIPSRVKLKKRGYAHWSRAAVTRMLHKSAYRGVYENFAWKKIGGRTLKNPNKDELIGVPVPQIVPETTWIKAQEKLATGRTESTRGEKYEYLVGRRIRCECGYYMRSQTTHHSYTNKKGITTTTYHGKYRCPGSANSGLDRAIQTCTMQTVSQNRVDQKVWQWIKEEVANPVILERKLREIQSRQRESMGGKQEALDTLYAHKEQIEEELKRLGSLYGKQGMPSRIVDELIAQEGHKLELIEGEIKKIEEELVTPLTDEVVESLLLFSMEFSEHLEATEQTFEGRRTVIDGLDVTVEVFRKDGAIYLRYRSILNSKPREISLTDLRNP